MVDAVTTIRYRDPMRERMVDQLETWRVKNKAEWSLTLALGFSPDGAFDPDASFKPHLRKLLKNVACEVFDLSLRQRKRLSREDNPVFFAGVYESHDRFGRAWPHIHGCVALRGQSEALLRGVLRDRWGRDEDADKPAIIGVDMVPVPVASRDVAARSVINRPSYRPSFCLRPITDAHWLGGYSAKSGSIRDLSMWTAPEIMNLAA